MDNIKRYLKKIDGVYRDGFIEDLQSGRHISAIICGYGATFVEDYKDFVEAFKQSSIFKFYDKDINGEI